MKLYLFYKKPSEEFCDNNPQLYAYTTDKEIASEFRKQRNMNVFIYKKNTEVSKKEYKNFNKIYGKYKLDYCQFYTKSFIFGKKVAVKILCTWKEEESVLVNSDKMWEEYSKYLFDSKMFKSEYLVALEKLLFMRFYSFFKVKFVNGLEEMYDPYYTPYTSPTGFIIEELKENYSYDDLKLFLRFFKDTFS